MKKMMRAGVLAMLLSCSLLIGPGMAAAADKALKVATISIQDVLEKSKGALEARKKVEAELTKQRESLQKEQQKLEGMREEIEKKSSVWSEQVRQEKIRDFQRLEREFASKSEDAQFAVLQLEKQQMEPILKELNEVIAQIGKRDGYTMILENTMKGLRTKTGLLYADEALDISAIVQQELDKRLKK